VTDADFRDVTAGDDVTAGIPADDVTGETPVVVVGGGGGAMLLARRRATNCCGSTSVDGSSAPKRSVIMKHTQTVATLDTA